MTDVGYFRFLKKQPVSPSVTFGRAMLYHFETGA